VTGKTVLVTGAGGRVGRYAVQIAAQSGATVIATTRAGKFDEVSRLGAHHVIDYTANGIGEALATAAPDGIDRVADGALWLTLDVALPALKARAQLQPMRATRTPPLHCRLPSCSMPTPPSRPFRSSACRRLRNRPPSTA
jgi:NADPH2:quinone reductase